MALRQCPVCGKMISEKAVRCPKCGADLSQAVSSSSNGATSAPDTSKQNAESQAERSLPKTKRPPIPQVRKRGENLSQSRPSSPQRQSSRKAPKQTGNNKSILILAVAIFAVVGVVVAYLYFSKKERNEATTEASMAFGNETFTVRGVSFDMVAVEGGTFQMGATSEQGDDAYDNEKPVHSVTLSDYWIGETEVTQELWQAVMGNNPSWFTGNLQRPVEQVSWYDCKEFVEKLNSLTEGSRPSGTKFRLPTEAEWEYAARGGKYKEGYKYSGSNDIDQVAWYYDNSNETHAVATKQANALGIYDMSGNVWEWCEDWYLSNYYSNSPVQNPLCDTPGEYSGRVLRGGSWYDVARFCRVSSRNYYYPDDGGYDFGLRLALSSLQ